MRRDRLKLYRFIEDAWEDGVREWCLAASEASLDGAQSWLVAAGAGQVHWIKRRALRDGVTLFGIRFLLPNVLRFELCGLLGVGALPLGNETLEFLLKLQTMRYNDPESLSQVKAPGPCLHAIARLSAAGRRQDARNLLPAFSRQVADALEDSRAWGPALDEELLFKAGMTPVAPLRTCFFGWDAAHWEYVRLFEATVRTSLQCEVYQSMPRSSGETLQQGWVKAVESRLNIEHEICRESEFFSSNETLVARLEGVDLEASVLSTPRFLIGRDWRDEIALVRDYIIERLAAIAPGQRFGIVAPRRSPSSLEIVRMLAECGISIFDETGEKQEPEAGLLIQLQIIRYHLLACDVDALLGLIDLLNDRSPGPWKWLGRDRARRDLHNAFVAIQTRNARLLAHAFESLESPAVPQIRQLVEALGSWEEETPWKEAREKWERCLRNFGLGVESLEPAWSLAAGLAGETPIPGTAFLEYLQAILSAGKCDRSPAADSPYAAVVVTTLSQARPRAWDGLIFLDSNEGEWPVKPDENPFLDDASCRALNSRKSARQGYLLDSTEQSAIDQSRFLDLLENCRGEIAFAAVARSEADLSREAYPNEWVIRALAESAAGDGGVQILDSWRNAVSICRKTRPSLPARDRERLAAVHASRRDPAIPFDEYLFNFGGSSFVSEEWSPSDLDTAATSPATFALKKILDAESNADRDFIRSEKQAIGRNVHRWLRQALAGGCEFSPFRYSDEARRALKEAAKKSEMELEERFRREGMALPLWWKSALRKAVWNAWHCLSPLAGLDAGNAGFFFVMEYSIRREIRTGEGTLKLGGRVDLLLADHPMLEDAAVRIIDFKTGKSAPPTLGSLDSGKGFQFAAYFLMAKAAGASSVNVGVIRPAAGFALVFRDGDEAELRRKMAALARVQRDLNFGQLGPIVAQWAPCESLPMATTPISPRILERKAALRNQ